MASYSFDTTLQNARHRLFIGTVRIRLDKIIFPDDISLKNENIDRLVHIFKIQDCLRLEPQNHLSALIDAAALDDYLRCSSLRREQLRPLSSDTPPELRLPANRVLSCQQGQSRIAAAKALLQGQNRWWTVDLYLKEGGLILGTHLRDLYGNEAPRQDGVVYGAIRQHRNIGDRRVEDRWWSYLSRAKRKNLRRFLRRQNLTSVFDRCLRWGALRSGIRFGVLHKILDMKIDEEIIAFWTHIHRFWHRVSRGQELDGQTVSLLENRCPKHSEGDRTFLRSRLDAGELFGTITNPTAKEEMWSDLCAYDYLVPSIRTFFNNCVYLDYLAKSMKLLIEKPDRSVSRFTVRSRLRSVFSRSSADTIQVGDTCFEEIPSVNDDEKAFMLAYQQVWLCAMRMWPSLVNGHPRITRAGKSDDMPVRGQDRRSNQSNFAQVAHRLGFRSAHIQSLFTGSLTPSFADDMQTAYVTDESSQRDVDNRSGVPMDGDFSTDASSLYFKNISRTCESPGYDVTILFIRRSFFRSIFFGEDIEVAGRDSPNPSVEPLITLPQVVAPISQDGGLSATRVVEPRGDDQITGPRSGWLNTTNRKRKTAADICTFKVFETPQLQEVHVPFDQRDEFARGCIQRSDTLYTAAGSRLHLAILQHSPHIDVVYVRGPGVTEAVFRQKLGFSADREINFRPKQIRRR